MVVSVATAYGFLTIGAAIRTSSWFSQTLLPINTSMFAIILFSWAQSFFEYSLIAPAVASIHDRKANLALFNAITVALYFVFFFVFDVVALKASWNWWWLLSAALITAGVFIAYTKF